MPRKDHAAAGAGLHARSFNEAAANMPRKAVYQRIGAAYARRRFNEAAANMPRKASAVAKMYGGERRLQ